MSTQPVTPAVQKVFDIGVGRYDVTISIGPSYQSRKDQAFSGMLEFLKVLPTAAPFIGDLVARSSNMPGAKEIADRLKKMLPAQLQEGNDPEQQMQQLQAQHAQMAQELQQCTQALQEAKQKIETQQVQASAQVTIARMNNIAKIAVAEITTKAQDARMRAEAEMDILQSQHDSAHDAATQAVDHAHEQNMAAQQHDQAMQQQESQQQAAQVQQVGQQAHEQGMAAQNPSQE